MKLKRNKKYIESIQPKTPKTRSALKLFLFKKLPLYYLLLASIASIGFIYVCEKEISAIKEERITIQSNDIASLNILPEIRTATGTLNIDDINILRAKDYSFIRPIILADHSTESEELLGLKQELNIILKNQIENNLLHSASVYVLDLDDGTWIDINDTEAFHPASLMKITLLICYLKHSETDPGILEKKLTLENNAYAPHQTFEEQNIQPGKAYTVNDLLFRMITRSDNFATSLLNENLTASALPLLFHTLYLNKLPSSDPDFTITTRQYSRFMRVLYNASYLSEKNSEKALSILTQTDFSKGLLKPLPKSVIVAHKFGENSLTAVKELHESGIVYAGRKTYLITVMTKGKNVQEQADVISDISGRVYEYFNR